MAAILANLIVLKGQIPMRLILTCATFITTASASFAGMPVSWAPSPSVSSGSDGSGALVVLLVLGALFLMNGARPTTTRNTAPRNSADQDDDIIMKF
ncbi:MAG: MYXO-CTERM domain-containing protein [Paracoccaceae bacterium]|jgi:MYXO-CTERM domain-containing protein